MLALLVKFFFSFIYTEKVHGLFNRVMIVAHSAWINKRLGTKFVRCLRGVVVSKNVVIGEETILKEKVVVYCQDDYKDAKITLGKKCWIGDLTFVSCINSITIGDNFTTGRFCLITDNSHGEFSKNHLAIHPMQRPLVSKGPIVIGDNVWIGEGVTICGNVKIGNGVIVAANSVVTHDVPDYCLVAGSPAKIVKQLN